MSSAAGSSRRRSIGYALLLIASIVCLVVVCSVLFVGAHKSYAPVLLTSERSGLVMERGAKVKLRGVEVGRVAQITGGSEPVKLQLDIEPAKLRFIPANVEAEIEATTAFGAKFVNLIVPDDPSPQRLSPGDVLTSRNVSTEVNTVFQNLVGVLDQIDVSKLNATLSALADGLQGQGARIGEATTSAKEVLVAMNPRMDTVRENFRSLEGFGDAYAAAADDILDVLDAAATTGTTITERTGDLEDVLLSAVGFGQSGVDLLAPNSDNIVRAIRALQPTTDVLEKYHPTYTCLLQGSVFLLNNMLYDSMGGANGKSLIVDAGLLLGDDPYRYPQHLPRIAAKGGPGGKPSCGSLPDATKKFPVRYLVTDTGFGTGLDIRPNPGIGFPGLANYFPVTKAMPEPPRIYHPGGPAPGPEPPYPGGPPHGAPLYGPDGTPLWPPAP